MPRPPRIGLIANEYTQLTGGMSTVARAMTDHFRQRGYEVHVFANWQCDPERETRFRVHPILTADLSKDLLRLARYRMDVWHALNFGYAPAAWVCKPFVLTVHGNDFLRPWVNWWFDGIPGLWRLGQQHLSQPPLFRVLASLALRRVDRVLAVSSFTAKRLRRAYPFGQQPVVVPNGVEPFFLQAQCHAAESPDRHPRRLLTVTALDARVRKNVDGVIRAMAIVGERLDLEYVVIGDGPARNHLESLAASLDLSTRVRFMGRVSAEDLRAAYESSSLFVLVPRPEADDVEGFGLVYLEAAAAGTPALGSRFGGAVDAIQDSVTGFFAEDASPDAIASSLERFFTGQIRFDAEVVRQHACEHAWPRVLGQVEREYGQLSRRVAAWLAAHPDEDNPVAQAK